MQHDAWFFVGIFAFIFLIWIATGGPTRPLSFAGPLLSEPGQLGGGNYLSFPRAPFGLGGQSISLPGSSSGTSGTGSFSNLQGVAFGPPSTYRGTVHLSEYVTGAGGDPGGEYVTISLDQGAAKAVTISNWSLESSGTGNSATIPVGAEVPASGLLNGGLPIVLQPGDEAVIISGESPIGTSFKENKCIGYFAAFQKFSPSLPDTCPAPSDELQQFFGGNYVRDPSCIDYVNGLSRCQAVLTPPTTVSTSCQNFLTAHLNYNGCVSGHQNDSDFKGNTWHIYLGRTSAMWQARHDVVKLTDAEGNTVDAFSY